MIFANAIRFTLHDIRKRYPLYSTWYSQTLSALLYMIFANANCFTLHGIRKRYPLYSTWYSQTLSALLYMIFATRYYTWYSQKISASLYTLSAIRYHVYGNGRLHNIYNYTRVLRLFYYFRSLQHGYIIRWGRFCSHLGNRSHNNVSMGHHLQVWPELRDYVNIIISIFYIDKLIYYYFNLYYAN